MSRSVEGSRRSEDAHGDAASVSHPTGRSALARRTRALIGQVAPYDTTVLILGDSGTGKEGVARELHEHSPRASGPFVPVNCAAIPAELMESELFGHERGAFSGATAMRRGRFELAEGGTLFLDEVAEMCPRLQAKLLRVVQERIFERVGSGEPRAADVRIVAATNRDLDAEVAAGRFRGDLYFRLNVFPIALAPLRDRIEDLDHLILALNAGLEARGLSTVRLAPCALASLRAYPWPGNVRELENLLERLAILHPGGTIDAADLPERHRAAGTRSSDAPGSGATGLERPCAPSIPPGGLQLRDAMQRIEDDLIAQALDRAGGVVADAARLLGIGRTTLVEKLKRRPEPVVQPS